MKKKERAHLKEDPFQVFIQKVLDILQKYKREIVIGLGVGAAVIIIILAVYFIQSGSVSKENRLYTEALTIKNNEALDIDQKIEQLAKLDSKSGISASVKLFLAALYFEKGDLNKSKEVLDGFSGSKSQLLNEEKNLLEAEILNASDKQKEALELLNKLLNNPKSEIAKDYILFKMAKIQANTDQTQTAVANLNRLIEDHPQSPYSYEARNLLRELEGK